MHVAASQHISLFSEAVTKKQLGKATGAVHNVSAAPGQWLREWTDLQPPHQPSQEQEFAAAE